MESLFILRHFELRISKTDERLLIEAESQQTSEIFSKKITDDMAKGLSEDSFFDLQTIYQVLTDFFTTQPPSVSVSLSDEGRLAYSSQFLIGNIAKEVGFVIQLEKQEIDPLKSMEKTIQKLNQRISELEEQVKRQPSQSVEVVSGEGNFEKMLNQRLNGFEKIILQRMDLFEKKFAKIEKEIKHFSKDEKSLEKEKKTEPLGREIEELNPKASKIKSIVYQFHKRSNDFSCYKLSNNDRTATSCFKFEGSGEWIFTQEPLETDKDMKFSFYISQNRANLLGIGIISERCSDDLYRDPTSYLYMSDGSVWKNGAPKYLNLPTIRNRETFTFVFEAANRELTIYRNDKKIDSHTYSQDDISTKNFYPCVYSNKYGATVAFI